MATKREKKVVQTGITQSQYETAMSEYAVADARLQKVAATMDVQIATIRDRYAPEMAKLEDKKGANFDTLQAYAMENKDILFAKKKSLENTHGSIGFRTGTPKLKTLKGFTWGAVTNLLKEFLPAYVRTTEEPAKDKLLADREAPEVAELLPKVGVSIAQDETFFVELKKETDNG
ncbi:MAG: host-nuclease inhibitor Gam family protein [Prevotellaceae bacterium]|jgi:phage host-nuclease inhibitor protein Gam|nr:host-nuclease inhibitor Gam family protein [Prevotellaceae bacterium]